MLFFAACKEDPGLIGLDVQPPDEYLNTDYFDTTTIIAYSTLHDSIVSSNVSVNMLGYMDDAVFGKTQAGIYTQFRLPAFKKDFGSNITVDSLVLTIAYSGSYGDTLNSFLVRVYELDEDLKSGTRYYTNSSLAYNSSSLTENSNLYIQPRPKTIPDTSASTGVMRIRLKSDFATSKFISQSNGSVYESQENFLNYFKGLLINAEAMNGNGCIVSLNMTHSLSGLTIYYSNSEAAGQRYMLKMDSTLHFGATEHFGYSTATSTLRDQLNGNYTSTSDILYGQAGAGIKVAFNFPNIRNMFKDKKVIIHRAALVINYIDDNSSVLTPPNALAITSTDSVKLSGIIPDYYLGTSYFGGKYNASKKQYRFHITQYIQFLVDGTLDNYQLNLLLSPNVTYFSRLQMYGTNPSANYDKRLRLEVNYTIIE
jgi:hypothetical protein